MEKNERISWAGIGFGVAAIAIALIGLGLVVYDSMVSDVEYRDPSGSVVVPFADTVNRTILNLTLNEGEYEIWYRASTKIGNVTVIIGNDTVVRKARPDPTTDHLLEKNGTTYLFLKRFSLERTSEVRIERTGQDGFYLTGPTIVYPANTLMFVGAGIAIAGAALMVPGTILVFKGQRKQVRAMKEVRRREREELKKVRFDPRNPKQLAGAILLFAVVPLSIAVLLGTIPLYSRYGWVQLLRFPLVVVFATALVLGFAMFHNKKMFGPGGQLSMKRAPPEPNGIDFFYECGSCGGFTKAKAELKEGSIRCKGCGEKVFREGTGRMVCPICRSSIFLRRGDKKFKCPFCDTEFTQSFGVRDRTGP